MSTQLLLSVCTGALLLLGGLAHADSPVKWNELTALTPELYTRAQICENAKASGKPFALVALKSHDCDYRGYQHCLKESYYLSDSCNKPVAESFALYHLRLEKNVRQAMGAPVSDWTAAQHAGLLKEWGADLEPSWILIDLSDCSVMARVSRKELHTDKSLASGRMLMGSFTPSGQDLMDEYTLIAKTLQQKMGGAPHRQLRGSLGETRSCLGEGPRPNMMELWDHLDGR